MNEVKSYLDCDSKKLKIFKNNIIYWYQCFVVRYSNLVKPQLLQNIKRSQARSQVTVSRTTINQ